MNKSDLKQLAMMYVNSYKLAGALDQIRISDNVCVTRQCIFENYGMEMADYFFLVWTEAT